MISSTQNITCPHCKVPITAKTIKSLVCEWCGKSICIELKKQKKKKILGYMVGGNIKIPIHGFKMWKGGDKDFVVKEKDF